MSQKINTPHDLFFRATLNSPQAIKDFFQAHLPQHLRGDIKLASIQPAQTSHISPSLKELQNDLVFTCQIGQNIGFIVVEHQSTPDWHMPLRFIKYNAAIIEGYIKDKAPGTPWPFILNICLYHAGLNKAYPYPTNLQDYYPNSTLTQEMAMLIKFHLINLSNTPDNDLERHGTISLMEKMFKYRGEKELFLILEQDLDRCIDWILGIGMIAPPLGADYWKTLLYYTLNVLDTTYTSEEKVINLFIKKLSKSKEEIMATIAQQIEKRSIEQGRQEGRQEGMQQVAKSMLKKDLTISLIQEVTGLSKQTIEELKKG